MNTLGWVALVLLWVGCAGCMAAAPLLATTGGGLLTTTAMMGVAAANFKGNEDKTAGDMVSEVAGNTQRFWFGGKTDQEHQAPSSAAEEPVAGDPRRNAEPACVRTGRCVSQFP